MGSRLDILKSLPENLYQVARDFLEEDKSTAIELRGTGTIAWTFPNGRVILTPYAPANPVDGSVGTRMLAEVRHQKESKGRKGVTRSPARVSAPSLAELKDSVRGATSSLGSSFAERALKDYKNLKASDSASRREGNEPVPPIDGFGSWLHYHRSAGGISQLKLSKMLQEVSGLYIPQGEISRMERGTRQPTSEEVVALEGLLGKFEMVEGHANGTDVNQHEDALPTEPSVVGPIAVSGEIAMGTEPQGSVSRIQSESVVVRGAEPTETDRTPTWSGVIDDLQRMYTQIRQEGFDAGYAKAKAESDDHERIAELEEKLSEAQQARDAIVNSVLAAAKL
jgi:hypothetical protein